MIPKASLKEFQKEFTQRTGDSIQKLVMAKIVETPPTSSRSWDWNSPLAKTFCGVSSSLASRTFTSLSTPRKALWPPCFATPPTAVRHGNSTCKFPGRIFACLSQFNGNRPSSPPPDSSPSYGGNLEC